MSTYDLARIPLRGSIRLASVFIGRLDVRGAERRPVVKLHALAQLHFQSIGVDEVQRFREFEHYFVRLFRPHRAASEIAEHEAFNDQLTEIGVGGRIPIAGQGLGAEEPHGAAFSRESRIHQEVRVDPSEAGGSRRLRAPQASDLYD